MIPQLPSVPFGQLDIVRIREAAEIFNSTFIIVKFQLVIVIFPGEPHLPAYIQLCVAVIVRHFPFYFYWDIVRQLGETFP